MEGKGSEVGWEGICALRGHIRPCRGRSQLPILWKMTEKEVVRAVVAKLRAERESQGISQAELSRKTGLSRSGIRHMEAGEVSPTLEFLLRVARVLEVKLSKLLGGA